VQWISSAWGASILFFAVSLFRVDFRCAFRNNFEMIKIVLLIMLNHEKKLSIQIITFDRSLSIAWGMAEASFRLKTVPKAVDQVCRGMSHVVIFPFGLSVMTDPPFCHPKNPTILPKFLTPRSGTGSPHIRLEYEEKIAILK